MITGNGDIASVLTDKPNINYFASGVSNSGDLPESEYQREKDLLLQQDKNMHIVYISSLCVFYGKNRYTMHKIEMEQLVKREFPHYTIMRLGNIDWGDNPNTIINYLRNKIRNNEPYEIQDTYRYIIDKEEFLHWISLIPKWSCEMNCPGKMMKVEEIIKKYIKP